MPRITTIALLLLCPLTWAQGQQPPPEPIPQQAAKAEPAKPAFGERIANSPFVELYVLEELKQLRQDMAAQKVELVQQIVDREISAVDRGVAYATDTITYFFYLIAAASSMLVLVGWTSVRDMKERVHSLADKEISKLVKEYETRLHNIESQLSQKTQEIEQNREEIQLTQEVHSLWLRAAQDISPQNKISIYDNILKINSDDTEALTYKADAVLELSEPQWAINLCNQALSIDPENSHAFYQLACAYTALDMFDDAVRCLAEALNRSDAYREQLSTDLALARLRETEGFNQLMTKVLGND
jgi:tetratricopeptide (TPR) repeat protein